jgi:antitoxin component YwqK of YwqJK toxin-antitoxin module
MKVNFKIEYFFGLILLLAMAISPKVSVAQNTVKEGYNKLYYANGKLSSEGIIRDGKPDGYWKTYYESGKIKSEGNRKNFVLDSTWKFYSEKGLMYVAFNYANGKKNGFKQSYGPSRKDSTVGILIAKENYRNDTLQGFAYYYKGGKLSRIMNYKDGLLEGKAYDFSPDSLITVITIYKGGFVKKVTKINQYNSANHKEGLWQTFYDNGNVKYEGTYQDGKRDGYFRWYNQVGSMDSIKKYINDVLQVDAPELAKLDIKTSYYPNGVVKTTGPIKNGQPFGVHNDYNEQGQIVGAKIYDSGKVMAEGLLDTMGIQQGEWKEYHENGQLKSVGKYLNGAKVGEWKYYFPDSKMFETGKYDNQGRQQGKWMWYYDNGKLRRESNFFNGQEDGDFIEYADSNGVITKGQYSEGLKEGIWTYNMGNYSSIGKYTDDQQDSLWKEYYNDNHKVRFEGNYNQGRPDGKHTWYYPDGKKEVEGQYTMGLMEDKWKYYTSDGDLLITITFKDDVEIKFDAVKVEP